MIFIIGGVAPNLSYHGPYDSFTEEDGVLICLRDGFHPEAFQKSVFSGGVYREGTVEDLPAPTITADQLAVLRAGVVLKIKAERDRRESTGGVLIGGKWFHTDDKSLTKYLGLKDKARDVLLGGGTMASPLTAFGMQIQWTALGGSMAPMTAQLAFDLVAAVGNLQAALFYRASVHVAAVNASDDPENYNYKTGWPDVFEG